MHIIVQLGGVVVRVADLCDQQVACLTSVPAAVLQAETLGTSFMYAPPRYQVV